MFRFGLWLNWIFLRDLAQEARRQAIELRHGHNRPYCDESGNWTGGAW
jgi:hypothetical protein